jgi:hypothetical protein
MIKVTVASVATVLLLLAVASCHNEKGCGDHALRRGVRFEITFTKAVSSSACSAAAPNVGDTLVFATDDPVDEGANAVCTRESFQAPEGVSELHGVELAGPCLPQSIGAMCSGSVVACTEQKATLGFYLALPLTQLEQAGDEADGQYTVHLNVPEQAGCPALYCFEKFEVHAKRLN